VDDISSLLALADKMLWVTALVAAPVLICSLVVGLAVGIVQAATSVNEQTLTFVPKVAVIALVLVLFGSSMMALIGDFTQEIFAQVALVGQAEQVTP
jgi:Flagellar biosynthesis pathway, component FliQ